MNKIALVRIITFILAWVNSWLANKGMETLPLLSEQEIANLITFVVSAWVLVKDNSLKKTDKPV